MKSGWRVRTDYPEGNKMYQVYRLKNARELDTEENRETYAYYSGHEIAAQVAREMNTKEAEKYFRRTDDE